MRAEQSMPRASVLQEPTIVVVAQGRKHGYLGERAYSYDANNCLIVAVPMHFECETEVDPDVPMLAVAIRIDISMVGDVMLKMDQGPPPIKGYEAQGMYVTPLDEQLGSAVVRLLESLSSHMDARILGPQILREVTYRVLCGEGGLSLRSLFAVEGRLAQIQRAISRIQNEYGQALDIATLAREAGMSVSAFHHNFKAVTGSSPMQYLKTTRLHKAREFMVQNGVGAASAAYKVGYASAPQFSREFKRLFSVTPATVTRARVHSE